MEKKLYNPIMEWAWTNELCVAELIGYAAAFCGTVSLIPQIVKLWKERSAKDCYSDNEIFMEMIIKNLY